MGEVFVVFKISVEDQSLLGKVKEEIKKLSPKELKEENIGFGIKVLKAMFVVMDEGINSLEEKISSINGVSSVDVEDLGRI